MKVVVLVLAHFFPFNIINAANRIRAIRASETQYMAFRYMILSNQKSKGLMAFSRRVMLLNVGDTVTTMWAIVLCAVSDLILRCFLVDIDTQSSKSLDRVNIKDKNSARAKIRQAAWACELNLPERNGNNSGYLRDDIFSSFLNLRWWRLILDTLSLKIFQRQYYLPTYFSTLC